MKKLIFLMVLVSGCNTVERKVCVDLDGPTGFARCETKEVVCYESKSGQACWPRGTPSAQPDPAKAPKK